MNQHMLGINNNNALGCFFYDAFNDTQKKGCVVQKRISNKHNRMKLSY